MTIAATVLAHSVNAANGVEILSFLLRYHQFAHNQVLTHRVLGRNAASSRAVPVARRVRDALRDPAVPVSWGRAQRGMTAAGPLSPLRAAACRRAFLAARYPAAAVAWATARLGLAKETANRLLEPWQWMTSVVTATEWSNFYTLRTAADAQPEVRELALAMLRAHAASVPAVLKPGQWHLPFWRPEDEADLIAAPYPEIGRTATRRAVCTARCVRTSYVNFFGKNDWAADVATHDRCAELGHWSGFEHVAQARGSEDFSGHLRGWTPYRKFFAGESGRVAGFDAAAFLLDLEAKGAA